MKTLETYSLEWYEYIVFGLVLASSMSIGFFFGCCQGKKNKTNEDFLMAGRSMSAFPVTLSLLCGFVSAITLLGNPVEIYFYGSQYVLQPLAFIPMTLLLVYIYVPVYFELQLTSAYEYFEWRFSRSVRILLSICAVIQVMVMLPITVLGPSMALQQVAGIDPTIAAGSIYLVCVAYSAIGGLKAVLWTDVLQSLVMLGALLSVVGLGIHEVGGLGHMWETARSAQRTNFFNFDFDPRTRHTVWTSVFGTCFMWLSNFGATQGPIQRYNSVPTLRQARTCLFYNMLGMMGMLVICYLIGLSIFTRYVTCDPVDAKLVTSPDQLVPFFVMDVLSKYPGIAGLLIAGLTCASLSTVSSGINAAAAIITEDFVRWFRPNMDEVQLGFASKIVSVGFGLVSFGFIFLAAAVNDTVQIHPFSSMLTSCFYGPILGAFTLGIFFPWANNFGTLVGIIVSVILTSSLGTGNIIAGKQGLILNQKLPLTTDGCGNDTFTFYGYPESRSAAAAFWKHEDTTLLTDVWNISYVWHSGFATILTVIVGLIVSFLSNAIQKDSKNDRRVNHSLMSKPILSLWKKCLNPEYLDEWVDFSTYSYKKNLGESDKLSNGVPTINL